MTRKANFVVEADIKSFFDTVDHNWLIKFLEHDIEDKKLIRLIKKFLKAGVIEQGKYADREEGTPQGSGMSPVLANVYLHYVLDLWFEKRFKKSCKGEAHMVRFCDDWVCTFQYEEDAERFMTELEERLKKFGLEVEKSKTKKITFGRYAKQMRAMKGEGRPETFNFLGFTFICGRAKFSDKFNVLLRTERKRFAAKLRKLKDWLYEDRTTRLADVMARLNKILVGHYRYYGITTNYRQLARFRWRVTRHLYKILNRRSQKRSYNWTTFNERVLKRFPLAAPKIYVY